MKNWEAAAQLCCNRVEVLKLFGVDPDAEFVEPVKPQPAPAKEEYDAGWVAGYWGSLPGDLDAIRTRERIAEEAARREREKCAEEMQSLRAELDRMAAELAAVKAQPQPSAELAENAKLFMLCTVDPQWIVAESYEQAVYLWQKSTSGISETALPDIVTLVSEEIVIQESLAQAVAGMGGSRRGRIAHSTRRWMP